MIQSWWSEGEIGTVKVDLGGRLGEVGPVKVDVGWKVEVRWVQ